MHKMSAVHARLMGVLAGVNDIIIVLPWTVVFLEIKAVQGDKALRARSEPQRRIHESLRMMGWPCFTVGSVREARDSLAPFREKYKEYQANLPA